MSGFCATENTRHSAAKRLPNALPQCTPRGTSQESTDTDMFPGHTGTNTGNVPEAPKKAEKPRKSRRKRPFRVAPLNTPLERRLQTLAVAWHTISIPFFCCVFLFLVYRGRMAWLCVLLPYFVWFYGIDLHTPANGKVVYRVQETMRNLILWHWFVDYFPIRVHKTCELEPTFTDEVETPEAASDDEQDLVADSTSLSDVLTFLRLRKRPAATLGTARKKKTWQGLGQRCPQVRRRTTGPRYIFGYHPHGVISMGVMGVFATNVLRNEPFEPPLRMLKPLFHDPSKGQRLFPGIGHVFPLTLMEQFVIPFFRDYLLSMGLTSASGPNIKSIISNGDNSVCLVVGGAQESLLNDVVGENRRVGIGSGDWHDPQVESSPSLQCISEASGYDETVSSMAMKQIRLVLQKRKGFVKLAIELGNVSLVPVFAFGEADIYRLSRPRPGSWGYSFQRWMKTNFHFTLPFFSARGMFIYDFGFLPYRTPINVVTGKPIYVPAGLLLDELDDPKPKKERLTSISSYLSLKRKKLQKRKRKVPQDILDHYHRLYVEELRRLYEDNKEKFGYGDVELKITE